MITIDAGSNPAFVNQMIEKNVLNVQEEEESLRADNKNLAMEILLPSDGSVELLGGIFDPFSGELIDSAEVRELNGADEEALSKIKDYSKGLLTILKRGTVSIGGQPATQELLDKLLAGDREYLILKIRQVTLGDTISIPGACVFCDEQQTFEIDLSTDVKINRLENKTERIFTVQTSKGLIEFELPTGYAQKKLVDSNNKTAAELDSILLAECITAVNGIPVMDKSIVQQLSMKDRREILKELSDKNPGPELSSTAKNCAACGQEVPIPLALADLFRL